MKFEIFKVVISFVALCLFLLPHTTILSRPLIGLHDMDNGHLLTTVYLWRTEGIVNHHFAPIYSFPPADINLRTWGLVGNNNRMYHASYPPLSFWLVYLTSFLPDVGISEAAAHLTSIAIFLLALIFLFAYLYSTYNLPTSIFGAGLFSLVPPSIYFFGGLTVADIVVFGFWIPSFVFLSFYLKYRQKILLLLFFLTLGLTILSEWIGLLTAIALIIYFIFNAMRMGGAKWNTLLLGTIVTTVFSLIIPLVIYLSISSPASFFGYLANKYVNRANAESIQSLGAWIHRVGGQYLWYEYSPLFWLIVGLALLSIILFYKNNKALKSILGNKSVQINLDAKLIVVFFIFPPLFHTAFLSQFHYIHNYSFLSYLPALVLFSAYGFYLRWKSSRLLSLNLAGIILLSLYVSTADQRDYFLNRQTGGWLTTVRLFTASRDATNPDDLILTNHDYYPDMWFYLRRNAVQWVAEANDINVYSGYYPLFPHVYYTSDYRPFVDSVCGERALIPVAHGWMCRIK